MILRLLFLFILFQLCVTLEVVKYQTKSELYYQIYDFIDNDIRLDEKTREQTAEFICDVVINTSKYNVVNNINYNSQRNARSYSYDFVGPIGQYDCEYINLDKYEQKLGKYNRIYNTDVEHVVIIKLYSIKQHLIRIIYLNFNTQYIFIVNFPKNGIPSYKKQSGYFTFSGDFVFEGDIDDLDEIV